MPNVLDVVITVNVILLVEPLTDAILSSADLNFDGEVDVLDVVLIVNIVMEGLGLSCESDINSDGIVDILDIVSLVSIIMNR